MRRPGGLGEWIGKNAIRARKVLADQLGGVEKEWLSPGGMTSPLLNQSGLGQLALLAEPSNLNTTARYVRPYEQDLERAVDRLAWGVNAGGGDIE